MDDEHQQRQPTAKAKEKRTTRRSGNTNRARETSAAQEKYARSLYLSMGLQRSYRKVAAHLADEELLREAYPGTLPDVFRRNFANVKLMDGLRNERRVWWERRCHTYKHRIDKWSAREDWVARAAEWEDQRSQEVLGKVLEGTASSYLEQIDTGRAVRLTAGNVFLEKAKLGEVGAQAAVQALGMGTQMERSARQWFLGPAGLPGPGASGRAFGAGQGGQGALEVPSLASLMAGLAHPGGAQGQPGGPQQVNISQVNVTNQQQNNVLAGPLTVDVLRELQAKVPHELADWRARVGLPSRDSSEEPWVAASRAVAPAVTITPPTPIPTLSFAPAGAPLPRVVDADKPVE
jgi:hypothetical protein